VALCRPAESGETSFRDLVRAFGQKGLVSQARRIGMVQLRELSERRQPVILHLNEPGNEHFAVLKDVEEDCARLVDDNGEYRLPLKYLARWWDGYALIVSLPTAQADSGKAV
jgi:predicted double-glycine peptidase